MKPRAPNQLTIDFAMSEKRLLGAALGNLDSWETWRVALKSAFALGLVTDRERELFASIAGGRAPPEHRVRELWAIVGRRAGKSRMAALIACYIACFIKHNVAPGETPTVLALAASLDQAKTVFAYCRAFLLTSPVLCKEVESSTANEIRLRNGVVIAVHPNSFRTSRGKTLIAAIFDEASFWRSEESASPDSETYSAILPSLATTNGMLISISSAYRRAGLMYAKHRDYFGVDNPDVLVLAGTSLQFNPLLDTAVIDAQRKADPVAARSEWDSEFRSDLAEFLSDELIERSTDYSRPLELPPRNEFTYFGFCDPSGGSGFDSYTFAIAHMEGERIVLDLVRGTPRGQAFNPAEVTKAYSLLAKEYRIYSVCGDYYAAEWNVNAWGTNGITYQRSPIAKSQIYLECLPLFSREAVSLPVHQILLRELRLLERRTARTGRDVVNHSSTGHDDYSNAACGALLAVSAGASGYDISIYLKVNDTIPENETRLDPKYETYAEKPGWFARDEAELRATPLWGPNAPGAVSLGQGGYRAPTHAEREALGLDDLARQVNKGKRPGNVAPW